MFKIVHLLAGVVALLLSFIPSLGAETPNLLQQPEVVYLVFCALFNLFAAGQATGRTLAPLQVTASILVILATAAQALVVLAPLPLVAGQPAVLLALSLLIVAAMLQLIGSLPARRRTSDGATPLPGNRESGTVKWFNPSKGFGFISRDSGDDIFVHFRAIRGEGHRVLVEGQRVEFVVMQRDKGLQAEDVVARR